MTAWPMIVDQFGYPFPSHPRNLNKVFILILLFWAFCAQPITGDQPGGSPQFGLFVLAVTIGRLVGTLLKPQVERIRNRNGTGKRSEQSEPCGSILIGKAHVPPTESDQRTAYKEKQYRLERRKFSVEVITLLVLIGYTTINYWLYQDTQVQLGLARDQLHLAHRAWVLVDDLTSNADLTSITFWLKNSGTGPANSISLYMSVCSNNNVPPCSPAPESGLIRFTRPSIAAGSKKAITYHMTKKDIALLLSVSMFRSITMVGFITYTDQFGISRRSNLCWTTYIDRRTATRHEFFACPDPHSNEAY